MKLDAIISASEKELASAPGHVGAKAVVDNFFRNTVAGALGGLSAGIEQGREERSVERRREELCRQILKLEVAKELQEQLLPRFEAWGYRLEKGDAEHPFGKPYYTYTALQQNGIELALVQLPPEVFATDDSGNEIHVGDFSMMLKAFREKTTRMFAQGVSGITYKFSTALDDESRGADWKFIPWPDVIKLREEKLEFWQAFKLPKPSPVPNRAIAQPKTFSDTQFELIVKVLTRFANDYPTSDAAFRDLVTTSGWPQEWKDQRLSGWTNAAPSDARTFLTYMMDKNTFPAGHELAGRSVLGEFLRKLLARNILGGKDADALARIVVECALVADADQFSKYYIY
jgi:hypothetical protein